MLHTCRSYVSRWVSTIVRISLGSAARRHGAEDGGEEEDGVDSVDDVVAVRARPMAASGGGGGGCGLFGRRRRGLPMDQKSVVVLPVLHGPIPPPPSSSWRRADALCPMASGAGCRAQPSAFAPAAGRIEASVRITGGGCFWRLGAVARRRQADAEIGADAPVLFGGGRRPVFDDENEMVMTVCALIGWTLIG